MADSTLEIKIRALVEGLQQVQSLAGELKNTSQAATGAGKSAKNASSGLDDLTKSSGDSSKSAGDLAKNLVPASKGISTLHSQVKGLIVGFIALAGVMSLKQAADIAARAETLGVTLGVVAKNAGYTAEQIASYEKELKGLGITASASRESLTQLIQAGINLTETNEAGASTAAQLARAAQDLAVVTGENSSETLQKLITNIRQLDSVGLRYMGLTVDIAGAQDTFAASIGKTANGLTQQQKQMAVMNAAMDEATKLQGSYEASMATVGKQMASMSRYQEEAAKAIGDSLLPAYAALVGNATQLLKTMQEVAEEVRDTTNFAETFGAGMDSASGGVTKVVESLIKLVGELAPAFGQLVQAAGEVAGLLGDVVAGLTNATTETQILQEVLKTVALLVAGLADGMRLIGATISLISSGWMGMIGYMTHGIATIVQLVDVELGNSIRKAAFGFDEMAKSSKNSFDQVMSDFANGDSAVQRFIASQDESQKKLADYGKASTFKGVEEEIRQLTAAQRDGVLNSVEAIAAGTKITESIEAMGAASSLTAKEVATLNSKVKNSLDGVQTAYAAAIKELKLGLVELNGETLFKTLSEEAAKLGGALVALGENGLTTGDQFNQAFSKGLDSAKSVADLEAISESLLSAKNSMHDVEIATALARGAFDELFSADLKAARTEADLKSLEDRLIGLENQGVISAATLAASIKSIDNQSAELADTFNNMELLAPLEALGLSFKELSTGVSGAAKESAEALSRIVLALTEVGSTATMTQGQLYDVFTKSIGGAKTLADLSAVTQELTKAKDAGVLLGQAYKDAAGEATAKFNELFTAQLKSANTKTEFSQLVEVVKTLGSEGAISAQQMANALSDIDKKAKESKQSVLELATQSANMAEQNVSAVRASAAVSTAKNALETENKRLLELSLTAQKEGTKEARAALQLQQAVVNEAKANYQVVQAKYRYELAQLDALIAKHRQLAAEKAVADDPSNEVAQQAVRAAEAEAEKRQIIVEKTREGVAAQEALAVQAGKAKEEAQAFAEAMGVATGSSTKAAGALGTVQSQAKATSMSIATWTFDSVLKALTDSGVELDKAAGYAQALMGNMKGVAAFGSEGIANYRKITEGIQAAAEKEAKLVEDAQKLRDTYSEVADRANAIADGLKVGTANANLFSKSGDAMQLAMREVQRSALQAAASAKSASQGFMSSAISLKEEMLSATGQEDQAARLRFDQRRKELALEHQMLKLKLQAAIASGRAAGVSTSDLTKQLGDANRAYRQSLTHIAAIESVENKKRQDAKADAEAQKRAKEEQLRAEVDGVKEVAIERSKLNEGEKEAGKEQVKRTEFSKEFYNRQLKALKSNQALGPLTAQLEDNMSPKATKESVQSIANDKGAKVTKVVEHKFTDAKGNAATAMVPEAESERLIAILEDFRRRT